MKLWICDIDYKASDMIVHNWVMMIVKDLYEQSSDANLINLSILRLGQSKFQPIFEMLN